MTKREDISPSDGPPTAIEPVRFRPPKARDNLPRVRLPWAQTLVLIFIVCASWSTWYVITARSVRIATVPANAEVSIDGLVAFNVRGQWLLLRGRRQVRVKAPGYKPYRGEIVVSSDEVQTHQVELRPLPGHLKVTVTPIDGALITIDGVAGGLAPTVIRDVEAGRRELTVSADRYLPFTTIVDIEGRGIEQAIEIALKPAWSEVNFRSQPPGATVVVGGESLGQTPLSAEVMHGERTVRIELDGYKPWQQKFQLAAGGKRDLPNVLLTKADGYLQVTSLPVGASISVDGRFKGKSPLKLAIEPDKQHEVAAVKAGYARGSRQVKVASGETTAVQLELEPELATVHFVTDPSDAELLIDGKPRGSATQSLQLPTHEHRILVQRDGYGSYETTITPRKGVRKRIKIRLKTTAEIGAAQKSAARGVSSAGRLTTYVGSELKLFRGGDVTLGSSRRDPGRRANEAMYSVKLARPFYISLKEVTNADFRKFLANHVSAPFGGVEMNADAQPVVGLPWENAAIFCNWLSRKDSLPVFYQIKHGKVLGINPDATGYRLPSEAEWGWVARTTAGGEPFDFPWAGNYPPRGQSGNYADASASHLLGDVLKDYNDGYAVTAPVGSYPANLRGIYDLGGNVAEWVHDFYTATPAGGNSAKVDPLGPRSGESHVIRGSSWARSSLTELRLAYRDSGTAGRDDVGFRIARYAQ